MNAFTKYLGPEDHLHIQVVNYIKWKYRGAVVHHSPNEGKRSPFERWKIEQLHVSPGFPDLIIFNPPLQLTLAIELKTEKNRRKNPNQEAWIETLNQTGIPAKKCFGYDEAVQFLDQHLKQAA